MVVQVIESRYTVDYDILIEYLKYLFEPESFEIIAPDEGEKWKIQVPRELVRDELVALQRKFKQAISGV